MVVRDARPACAPIQEKCPFFGGICWSTLKYRKWCLAYAVVASQGAWTIRDSDSLGGAWQSMTNSIRPFTVESHGSILHVPGEHFAMLGLVARMMACGRRGDEVSSCRPRLRSPVGRQVPVLSPWKGPIPSCSTKGGETSMRGTATG